MNYAFINDYSEICADEVYDFVGKHINEKMLGYEEDVFCKKASNIIRDKFEVPEAQIQFFIGGTSTNMVMISHMLKCSYEAVIATKYAHICCHEGGAIEGSGHKILIADDDNGKIIPESIEKIYLEHEKDNHMVIPKMVYISDTTEVGTVYTRKELEAISNVCKKYGLMLFLDGARIFSALYSSESDLKIEDFGKYTDAFYIGGTKNGLMLGEAAVIVNEELQKDFMRMMKNKGAMLAKGSLIGLNFLALFENDFYRRSAENANKRAMSLAEILKKKGFSFTWPAVSNQLFVEMTDEQVEELSKDYAFADMGHISGNEFKTVRFVTSFSTTERDIREFERKIDSI